jgi:hypothetical protein
MRFMSMVKGPDGGIELNPELMAAIGAMAQEMAQAGVLVDMGGLLPSAKGARIRLSGGKLTEIDGPFTEAKELIGGFAIFDVRSKDEMMALSRRFMQIHADILGTKAELELEVREMEGPPPR